MLDRVRPDVVVGYGGYVSVPAYLAARRAEVPIVVHEQNALPGLANKVGARIARRVAVSFPDTPLPHAEYVGLPIRTMISGLDRAGAARRGAGVLRPRPRPPDAGGDRRLAGCPQPQHGGLRRRPRAGRGRACRCCTWSAPRTTSVPAGAACPTYVPVGFVDRMDYALAAADLMVCRAGASSVTEAAAVGVPAIFVPLPIGNGEQALNAQPVVDAGGALLVDDADVHRDVGDRARAAAGHRPGAAGRDERRRLRADPARRRREAGPDRAGDRQRPDEGRGAGRAAAGRAARPRALRRHRRRRAVRIARIMLARGIAVSGSDGVDSPTLDALRGARRAGARRPRRRPARRRATPSWCRPRCARTTPSTSRPLARGLRVLPALGRPGRR